eukprot:TRINITY_DN6467_c0_g1_i5.p1 TRINITY_DN6467_c0_g1~~TRINITY_DN6467_c0_g1_i5.p1  ORF type:complete len:258 (-),score=22.90 TRINITY_DN6467_c0_g1_i5:346-1119(-)
MQDIENISDMAYQCTRRQHLQGTHYFTWKLMGTAFLNLKNLLTKKFTMDSFFHYTDDYSQYVEEVVKTHPLVKEKNLPIFCGGDSMGGQLTAMLAILHKSEFKGILLTCPSIDVERNIIMNIQLLFSEVLFRTMPYKRLVPAIPLEDVTDEPEVRERIEKDELYEKGNVAVKAAYQFLKGFKFLREHEHELTLPILVVIGSNDKVVNMNAIERFMKNVQSKDATMTKVMGGCHQLLDGSKVDEYVNAIVGWLDTHYK